MNENEMIKDLTNILKNQCDNVPYDYCVGCGCNECNAKTVINAGYRKVGEDEIVIKKRQYEQLKKHNRDRKRLRLKWQQAKQELEQAKKETASEVSKNILTKLADDFSGLDGMEVEYPLNKVKELAKQLSVEI